MSPSLRHPSLLPPLDGEEAAATEVIDGVDGASIGRWYGSTRRISWPLRRLWLDIQLEDAANVPSDGGVVLAANHASFLDSVLLMYSLPRRVSFLGKAEYLSAWPTRKLFPAAGMIPVDRSGRGVSRSLDEAGRRLRSGEVVGIFPEGTRSRDGRLHRGHTGVAHLALRSQAPIVPVGIVGSDEAQPPGARFPRYRSRVSLRFGSPVDLGRWAGQHPGGHVKREITDAVMRRIAQLSHRDYVDDYAAVPVG